MSVGVVCRVRGGRVLVGPLWARGSSVDAKSTDEEKYRDGREAGHDDRPFALAPAGSPGGYSGARGPPGATQQPLAWRGFLA